MAPLFQSCIMLLSCRLYYFSLHDDCAQFLYTMQSIHIVVPFQGLKNCVHAHVRVHIVHTKALWHTQKNVYANYFSVKNISQLENYLYCFTKTVFSKKHVFTNNIYNIKTQKKKKEKKKSIYIYIKPNNTTTAP